MTTIDINGGKSIAAGRRFALAFRFKRRLAIWRRRHRAARYHMELARLDERLLYDIGLEPLDLHNSLKRNLPPSMLLDAMRRNLDRQVKRKS